MEVDLTKLPIRIQNQIPYSIRSKKNVYEIEKLPYNIQYLITSHLERQTNVEYDLVYDFLPMESNVQDFQSVTNYFELVSEYLKNYLTLKKGQYPFDPTFYSKLPYYIQTHDKSTQQTLISAEINRIVNLLSTDLSIPITITNFRIIPSQVSGDSMTYNVIINISVNNQPQSISLNL
jgi:hypothetical protein